MDVKNNSKRCKVVHSSQSTAGILSVCRLCINIIPKNAEYSSSSQQLCLRVKTTQDEETIEAFDTSMSEMIKFIVPTVNFNLTKNPQICKRCTEELSTAYHFKYACLKSNKPDGESMDDTDVSTEFKSDMCALCQKFVALNTKLRKEEYQFFKLMLNTCFSELTNLKDSRNWFKHCSKCMDSLKTLYSVTTKCVETEMKIKEYFFKEQSKSYSEINMSDVFQFFAANSEKNTHGRRARPIVLLQGPGKIEPSNNDCVETLNDRGFNGSVKKETESAPSCTTCEAQGRKVSLRICSEPHVKTPKMLQCDKCSYKTALRHNLKKHLLVHMNASEVTMHKCSICSYSTKHKGYLKEHEKLHNYPSVMHKCPYCSYETRHKHYINRHQKTHQRFRDSHSSKVNVFKCRFCPYETIYKYNIVPHEMLHSDNSMLRCTLCAFSTRLKKALDNHMKKYHESDPTSIVYTCDICQFTTRHKTALKTHLLTHSKGQTFQCYLCGYEQTTCQLRIQVFGLLLRDEVLDILQSPPASSQRQVGSGDVQVQRMPVRGEI